MNKVLKIFTISLVIILLISTIASVFNYSLGFDYKAELGNFDNATGNDAANNATRNIVGSIAVITRIIGMGVAVIMLIVLAMKYMIAAPGDKADIKKHAIVFVVGAVILFATTGILEIIANFASGVKATGSTN